MMLKGRARWERKVSGEMGNNVRIVKKHDVARVQLVRIVEATKEKL